MPTVSASGAMMGMASTARPEDDGTMTAQTAREPVERAEADPVRDRRARADFPRHRAEEELHQPERRERRQNEHQNTLALTAARFFPAVTQPERGALRPFP